MGPCVCDPIVPWSTAGDCRLGSEDPMPASGRVENGFGGFIGAVACDVFGLGLGGRYGRVKG
jgi:hypothetical protein